MARAVAGQLHRDHRAVAEKVRPGFERREVGGQVAVVGAGDVGGLHGGVLYWWWCQADCSLFFMLFAN